MWLKDVLKDFSVAGCSYDVLHTFVQKLVCHRNISRRFSNILRFTLRWCWIFFATSSAGTSVHLRTWQILVSVSGSHLTLMFVLLDDRPLPQSLLHVLHLEKVVWHVGGCSVEKIKRFFSFYREFIGLRNECQMEGAS